MFNVGPDGAILDANQTSCQRLESTRGELCRMRIGDLDPSYSPEFWPEHWKHIKRERSVVPETVHRTRRGTTFPVEVSSSYFEV
jgi:PAS domain-containing protein